MTIYLIFLDFSTEKVVNTTIEALLSDCIVELKEILELSYLWIHVKLVTSDFSIYLPKSCFYLFCVRDRNVDIDIESQHLFFSKMKVVRR